MAKQDIDIGVEGNDGTGDSIRESFRKVNENFNELYAVFGAGGQISFTNLGDTPNELVPRNMLIVNDAATSLNFVELGSDSVISPETDSVLISYDTSGRIILRTAFRSVSQDLTPTLGGPLDADGYAIANVAVTEEAANIYNEKQPGTGVTIDDLVITKGYADSRYISGDLPVRLDDEPADASEYTLIVQSYEDGNIVVPGHGFDRTINGTPYVFNAEDTAPAALNDDQTYYLRLVNSNQLAVYETQEEAKTQLASVAEATKIYISGSVADDDVHTFVDAGLDTTLEGFFLADEAIPRKSIVRRQGDTMTGELYLHDHPGELAGLSSSKEDLQAATKYYVDNTSYSSPLNLFVSTTGDDTMTGVPAGREGTSWTYAYRSVNKAAERAEEMIAASDAEPGPYMQTITIDQGSANSVVVNAGVDDPNYVQAEFLIKQNRDFIIREVTAYLKFKYPNFEYNIDTCERDLGLILDSVAVDITKSLSLDPAQNNANSLTRKVAERYYANASGRIAITRQYTETIDAIETARDIISSLLLNRPYRQTSISDIEIGEITKIVTSSPHGLVNTNIIKISGITTLSLLNDVFYYVKKINDTEFEIFTDIALEIPVDTSLEDPYNAGGGSFGLFYQTDEKQFVDPGQDAAATAISGVADKFNLIVNILTNGINAGQTTNFGKSYLVEISNGTLDTTDQGDISNRDILPGKVLVGKISGAQGRIVSYTPGTDTTSGNDIIELHLLKPIEFIENEDLEYGNFVNRTQITIFIESGQYEEDYPIKVPANVSVKGDEFRRVIIRPKDRVSQSKWANTYIYRDRDFDGLTISDSGARFYNQTGEFQGHFGYQYLTNPEKPVNTGALVINGGGYDNAAEIIKENKKFIQEETIAFIQNNTADIIYDHDIFRDDLENILNDIMYDIVFDTNFNANKWGLWFHKKGSIYLDSNLKDYWVTGLNSVRSNILSLASLQASSTATNRFNNSINTLINIIQNGVYNTETAKDIYQWGEEPGGHDADSLNAKNTFQANREFLAQEGLAKLKSLAPRKYFNEEIRLLQFRTLVDALSYDAMYEGNTATYDFVFSLFPFNELDVEITTRQETLDTITHLKTVIEEVLQQNAVTPTTGNSESQDTSGISIGNVSTKAISIFALIDDVVYDSVNNNNLVGLGSRNNPSTSGFTTETTDAQLAVISEMVSLQNDTVNDIDQTVSGTFNFNSIKCRRDVGLIVDALIEDLTRGGSEYSTEVQGEYYSSYILKYNNAGFGGQENATKGAIENIEKIIERLLDGEYLSAFIEQNQNAQDYVEPDFRFGTGEEFSSTTVANLITKMVFAFDPAFNPPKRNDEMDCFLMNDATILRNMTVQGHGGFLCVLDPEGQILTKSPYVQTGSSFSKSINSKIFAGGMFVDAYVGNLPVYIPETIQYEVNGPIVSGKVNNFELWVRSEEGQGLFVREPQLPCPFYIEGRRFQVNAISNYSQSGGFAKIYLDSGSNGGAGYDESLFDERPGEISRELYLQTAGNRSMLGNDFTQINDLGYALVTNNGAFSEMVSMFTYYCQAAYYAKNGSEIRSLNGSNGYGNFGLVAEGADPNEIPDQVTYEYDMVFPAKSFTFNTGDGNSNLQDSTSLFITDAIQPPQTNSIVQIDHGGSIGILRYRIGAVTINTTGTPTGGEYNNIVYRLQITGAAEGENGDFFSALQADVADGTIIEYRSATTHKFNGLRSLDDLKTRPSTAINFDESDEITYRSVSFGTSFLNDTVDQDSIYCTFDVPYDHVEIPVDDDRISSVGGSAGDTLVAVRSDREDIGQTLDQREVARLTYDFKGNTPPTFINENAALLIAKNMKYVAAETIAYVDGLPGLTYNTDKCYRDVQLIIHSVVNDVLANGNTKTIYAARKYYEQTTELQIPADQVQSTIAAIDYARDIVTDNILTQTAFAGSNTKGYSQDLAGAAAESGAATKVAELMNIVTDVIQNGYASAPTPVGYSGGMLFSFGGRTHQIIDYYQDDTAVPASNFVEGYQYEILVVGDTDWDAVVGNTGTPDTYSVGQVITATTSVATTGTEGTAKDLGAKILKLNPAPIHDITTTGTAGLGESIPVGKTLYAGLQQGTSAEITLKISLCRATGHDFTQIGTGSFNDSNYPNVILGPPEDLTLAPYYDNSPDATRAQVWERRKGRVFWMSTDQYGFFRVGQFFSVDQAQGSIEFSGEIGITGANAIGFKKGVPVDEFSVDDTMGDNSDSAVPVEQAIVGYINRRLGRDKNNNAITGKIGSGYLDLLGLSQMEGDIRMGSNQIVNLSSPSNPSDAATKEYVDGLIRGGESVENLKNITSNLPEGGDFFVYTGSSKVIVNPPQDSGGSQTMSVGDEIEDIGTAGKSATIVDIKTGITDTLNGDPAFNNIVWEISYVLDPGSPNFNDGEVFRRVNDNSVTTTIVKGPFDEIGNARNESTSDFNITVTRNENIYADSEPVALLDFQIKPGIIENADVAPDAGIQQSKLLMERAGVRANSSTLYGTNDDTGQTSRGLAVFDNDNLAEEVQLTLSGPVNLDQGDLVYQGILKGTVVASVTSSSLVVIRTADTFNVGTPILEKASYDITGVERAKSTLGVTVTSVKRSGYIAVKDTSIGFDKLNTIATDTVMGRFNPGTGLVESVPFDTIIDQGFGLQDKDFSNSNILSTVAQRLTFSAEVTVADGAVITDPDTGINGVVQGSVFSEDTVLVRNVVNALGTPATFPTGPVEINNTPIGSIISSVPDVNVTGEALVKISEGEYGTTVISTSSTNRSITRRTANGSVQATSFIVGGSSTNVVISEDNGALVVKTPGQATVLTASGNTNTGTTVHVPDRVVVGTKKTSANVALTGFYGARDTQSDFQLNSNNGAATPLATFNGKGFVSTNWVYTPFIEAPLEGNTSGTGIGLGAGTGFTGAAADVIQLITGGSPILTTGSSGVSVTGTLSSSLALSSGGNFSVGNNTFTVDATTGNIAGGELSVSSVASTGGISGTTGTFSSSISATSASFTGNVDLGDATSDTISMNGKVDTNLLPSANTKNIGSGSNPWGTVYGAVFSGTATNAKYADLAENYLGDAAYEPGDVLVLGGDEEVTVTNTKGDTRVAGVVTTNPAHLMNSALEGDYVIGIALSGRVPCKVFGKVAKGDLLVTSAVPGYAIVDNNPKYGTIIGKAVQEKLDDAKGIVEVLVGKS